MLTQASDYRYCTPIAAGIKGSVLPMVDGTGAACVNRYEDIAFLVEAARERRDWNRGRFYGTPDYANVASQFERPEGVVARGGGSNFANSALNQLVSFFKAEPSFMSPGYHSGTFLPHDWRAGIYPVYAISDHAQSLDLAINAFFSGVSPIPRQCSAVSGVPLPLECGTLRAIHADAASMKRVMFQTNGQPISNASFDDAQFHGNSATHIVVLREPDSGSVSTAAYSRYYHSTISGDTGYYDNPASWTFFIRKPFYKNPITGNPYYQSLTAHINFVCEYSYDLGNNTGVSVFDQTMLVPGMSVAVAAFDTDHFAAKFTIDFTTSLLRGYLGMFIQELQRNPPYNGTLTMAQVAVGGDIFLDTGVIELPSTVPDSA